MFAHNKRLQYTVRVAQTNPGLANLLEQFGGLKGIGSCLSLLHSGAGGGRPGTKRHAA